MAYKTIKEIGKGSFGVVELVTDEKGQQWARKTFVPPNLPDVSNDDMRARFEREVRYQSEIDDPNVVRIYTTISMLTRPGSLWRSQTVA
jgi:serine/threonine protein kinase